MTKTLSRQRKWQIKNPTKANLLRQQTNVRRRFALLQQGIVKTHEELFDMVQAYEQRNGVLTGSEWWVIFDYLDWKYNNSAFTDLDFSRKLETEWRDAQA